MPTQYFIENEEDEPVKSRSSSIQHPQIIEYKDFYNQILIRDFGEDYLTKIHQNKLRKKR